MPYIVVLCILHVCVIGCQGPFATFKMQQDKDCDWTGLKFSPDGKLILISTNGHVIRLIDAFQGTPLQTFTVSVIVITIEFSAYHIVMLAIEAVEFDVLDIYILLRHGNTEVESESVDQFLRAPAGTAIARLSHRNSVCPFVCLSHGWIRQKRCKLGSSYLHHRLPQRL